MERYAFNGVDTLDVSRKHPLTGLECELVRRFPMAYSGYTMVVRLPLQQWAEAMANWWNSNNPKDLETAESYIVIAEENDLVAVRGFVDIETNEEEVTPCKPS